MTLESKVAQSSGVHPSTMSNRALTSAIFESLIGLKGTIRESLAFASLIFLRMKSISFRGSPLT